jgi:hypothetical protein
MWAQLEKADCWVFGDTLEHLRDPWKVLRRINKNMKSHGGGTLIACVPNAQHWSIQMRLNNCAFRYEDAGLLDRTHLRWFTRTTLIELFQSTGFQVVQGTARFLPQPAPEKIMQAIGSLAEASGAYATNHPLVGGFVLGKKSLDFVDFFEPTSNKSLTYDKGLAIANAVRMGLEPGIIYKQV